MIYELHEMLAGVQRRLRNVRRGWALAACWLAWAAVAAAAWQWGGAWGYSARQLAVAIAAAAFVTDILCRVLVTRATADPHWVARRIEAKHPELGAGLLAALEQAPTPQGRRLGYLQSSVVRDAVAHGRQHNWTRDVPGLQLGMARLANYAALALLAAACVVLFNRPDAVAGAAGSFDRAVLPIANDVLVEPGNAEVERGATLIVVANFQGAVPADASLLVEATAAADEGAAKSISMARSFEDPKFVGRLPAVGEDLTYRVSFNGGQTEEYRVTVFEYPKLERADVEIRYPEYTGLEAKRIEDVRRVTAVEGAELAIECRLNKEVADARLVDRNGEEVVLTRAEGDTPLYTATLELAESRRFKLHLQDAQGRKNQLPTDLVVSVTPNRIPELKIARPARDLRVSPIEEMDVVGEATDDFGLLRLGVSYSVGGGESADAVLYENASNDPTPKKQAIAHVINFEELQAKPDQLLAYYVWAEDYGPDGEPRQTLSDMYFAEVRHFEEIFRQGDQPTEQQQRDQQEQQNQQQGQGAAQQAAELAELQKQIINATWTLVRRETAQEPSPEFVDDIGVIAESQQQALSQLEELAAEITDARSRAHAAAAGKEMTAARDRLTKLADTAAPDGLRPAMSSEQAAYQALLKLRAREFDVVQSNAQQQQQGPQSGSASGAGSRSQQQLNELELSSDENRYETQSRAQSQQEQGQAEAGQARQVLDRLRELARRQEDLNDRVRELQSELEAAESEEERERLQRELKRLRDQQREILRDTEELQNDLENSENPEQTREAQEQLDQTRSRVQQASEALDDGRLSEAVNEGTRAGSQLSELRDEFRRRTADRFSEEMRDLRDSARELDARQEQLSQRLVDQQEQAGRSLRDSSQQEEVLEGLAEQQREYEGLIERMQQTVQEAEEPEPLLARELFDTVRQANDDQVDQALDITRQLLDVGIADEASQAMQAATGGIDRLREGVDRAADSVLGDATEALRRAERELEDLQEQLDREIEAASGGAGSVDVQPASDRESQDRGAQPGSNQGDSQAAGPAPDAGAPNEQGEQARAGDPPPSEQPRQPGPRSGQPSEQQQDEQDPQQGGGQPTDQQPTPQQTPGQGGEQPSEPGRGAAGQRGPSGGDQQRSGGGRGGINLDLDDLFNEQLRPGGPITGEDFREWNDRMRDVQDLLEDPELSADVARIRERAEDARAGFKRNSKTPDWQKLLDSVARPLAEVRQRIREEIRRQESPDSLVPIDRDPVPVDYVESVREYYERLGSGE